MPNFTFELKGGGKVCIEAKDEKTAEASFKAKKLEGKLIHSGNDKPKKKA